MRRLFALAGRSPTIAPFAVYSMLAAVLSVWFQYAIWTLCAEPQSVTQLDLPLLLALFVALGVTCFAWASLHAFGFVGEGSGAGFRLVLIGLVSRVFVSMVVNMTGAEADGSIYDALPPIATPVWLVRNVSLVTIGCGLMLVFVASGADFVRRRRGPRWMAALD